MRAAAVGLRSFRETVLAKNPCRSLLVPAEGWAAADLRGSPETVLEKNRCRALRVPAEKCPVVGPRGLPKTVLARVDLDPSAFLRIDEIVPLRTNGQPNRAGLGSRPAVPTLVGSSAPRVPGLGSRDIVSPEGDSVTPKTRGLGVPEAVRMLGLDFPNFVPPNCDSAMLRIQSPRVPDFEAEEEACLAERIPIDS